MQDATPKEDQPSRSAVASAFAILMFAWLAVLWPLPKGLFKESDTYWLIEVGRNILHHFALPTTDPYSFASLRTPWIVYQWLTEVVLALANTFALKGVAILGEVTLGLLLCVLIFRRMIRLGANSLVAFIVIAIVTDATYPDIATVRPQLFKFVLLFLLQTILEALETQLLELKREKLSIGVDNSAVINKALYVYAPLLKKRAVV